MMGGRVEAGSQDRVEIRASITDLMPSELNGHQTTVSFGLAKRVATNTILSHPFFKSMRATLDYDHNTVNMAKIGATFPWFDDVPCKSDTAPSSGTGNPQAFQTLPSTSLRE